MGITVTLMRQQRNSIFKMIEFAGLDPNDFRLEQVKDGNSEFPQVTHVPTESFFLFGMNDWNDMETSTWSPGRNADEDSGVASDWEKRSEQMRGWLTNIKREYYEPDLWEQSAAAFAGDTAADRTPFTTDEQAEISEQLRKILDYIAEQRELPEPEQKQLEVRFVLPLEDASRKLTRGQFKWILVGALVNEGVRVGFHSEALRDLFTFAAQALGHLFGTLPQLPA
jgi:hypothetical protein